ncbi:MAG TPA: ergothioneine biosynthesis protein EgtC [Actinomycetota bacterium]|nr:ergothioneine biosynthesis protein EgtC [Actinomycetota bacterium]
MAYVGPAVSLESVVLQPEHSLLHQSYRPKFQRHGTVNADGFGCGWFSQARPEPAVYRRDKPIWSDRSFASMAGVISSGAILAAVRDATTGSSVEESSTAPFTDSHWLFAHNGLFRGFDGPEGVALRRMLSDRRTGSIRGTSDSEVLFGLILDRMDEGVAPMEALRWCVRQCLELSSGAFNFLLVGSRSIYATCAGDSLYLLEGGSRTPGGIVVASEPFDDDPGWRPVPEMSALEANGGVVSLTPLEAGR